MNLVEHWIEIAKQKHGNLTKAVKHANMVCGLKLQPGSVHRMKKGDRPVPADLQHLMINDCLIELMQQAGFDWSKGNFQQLSESLRLPKRAEK